jgi:WD40 repeat protein
MSVVTAGLDGTASIWDRRTGRRLHTFATGIDAIDDPQAIAHFSPDGKLLLTASSSDAKIWNVQTRQLMHTLVDSQLDNHRGLTDAQFSPNGSQVVIACKDEMARIWDSQTGILIDTIENNSHVISSASFCPDGKKLVVTSLDGRANLWDLQDHRVCKTFTVTKPGIKKVAFSHYENFMATAAWTGSISVWNLQTGRLVHTFTGPTRIATPAEDFCVNLTDINPLIVGDYFSNRSLPLKEQTLLVTLDKLSRENSGGPIIQEDIPGISYVLDTLPKPVSNALKKVYKLQAFHAPHNILKPGLNRPFNTLLH